MTQPRYYYDLTTLVCHPVTVLDTSPDGQTVKVCDIDAQANPYWVPADKVKDSVADAEAAMLPELERLYDDLVDQETQIQRKRALVQTIGYRVRRYIAVNLTRRTTTPQ